MKIVSLYLRNFRNYEEAFIPFSPGINLILGENGEGKTNLLEALYFFINGRSFRTSHLRDLIMFGKDHFYLELHFVKNEIEQVLKVYADEKQRKILLNFTPLTQISSLFGILLGVLLTPNDYNLIHGHPSERRQFLDLHISQINPLYFYHLCRYSRAMKQRNVLLKRKERKSLEIWEEVMALSAAYITEERSNTIAKLERAAKPLHAYISNHKDDLSLTYHSQAKEASDISMFYKNQYHKMRERELDLGLTLYGPHKDDLTILLDGKEARHFGSEGQIRSTALSLRLSEYECFKKECGEDPLFFLDDVGMGLDKEREKQLYDYIRKLKQVFLTSPRDLDLPSHKISISQGALSPL